MKYIITPTGEVYKKKECIEFDNDLDNPDVFFNTENQKMLAKEVFENTGILVGELKKMEE